MTGRRIRFKQKVVAQKTKRAQEIAWKEAKERAIAARKKK